MDARQGIEPPTKALQILPFSFRVPRFRGLIYLRPALWKAQPRTTTRADRGRSENIPSGVRPMKGPRPGFGNRQATIKRWDLRTKHSRNSESGWDVGKRRQPQQLAAGYGFVPSAVRSACHVASAPANRR
jgi:hypothetical protein